MASPVDAQRPSGTGDIGRTHVDLPNVALDGIARVADAVHQDSMQRLSKAQMRNVAAQATAGQNAMSIIDEARHAAGEPRTARSIAVDAGGIMNNEFTQYAQDIAREGLMRRVATDVKRDLELLERKYFTDPTQLTSKSIEDYRGEAQRIMGTYISEYSQSEDTSGVITNEVTSEWQNQIDESTMRLTRQQTERVVGKVVAEAANIRWQYAAVVADKTLAMADVDAADYDAVFQKTVAPEVEKFRAALKRDYDRGVLSPGEYAQEHARFNDRMANDFLTGAWARIAASNSPDKFLKMKKLADQVTRSGALFEVNRDVPMPKPDEALGGQLMDLLDKYHAYNVDVMSPQWFPEIQNEQQLLQLIETGNQVFAGTDKEVEWREKASQVLNVELPLNLGWRDGFAPDAKAWNKLFDPEVLTNKGYKESAERAYQKLQTAMDDAWRTNPIDIGYPDRTSEPQLIGESRDYLYNVKSERYRVDSTYREWVDDEATKANMTAQDFVSKLADDELPVLMHLRAIEAKERATALYADRPDFHPDMLVDRLSSQQYEGVRKNLDAAITAGSPNVYRQAVHNFVRVQQEIQPSIYVRQSIQKLNDPTKPGEAGYGDATLLALAAAAGDQPGDSVSGDAALDYYVIGTKQRADTVLPATVDFQTQFKRLAVDPDVVKAMGALYGVNNPTSKRYHDMLERLLVGAVHTRVAEWKDKSGVPFAGSVIDFFKGAGEQDVSGLATAAAEDVRAVFQSINQGDGGIENHRSVALGNSRFVRLPNQVSDADVATLNSVTSHRGELFKRYPDQFVGKDAGRYVPVVDVDGTLVFEDVLASVGQSKYLVWPEPKGVQAREFTAEGSNLEMVPPRNKGDKVRFRFAVAPAPQAPRRDVSDEMFLRKVDKSMSDPRNDLLRLEFERFKAGEELRNARGAARVK